jgi:hypothetical protein
LASSLTWSWEGVRGARCCDRITIANASASHHKSFSEGWGYSSYLSSG